MRPSRQQAFIISLVYLDRGVSWSPQKENPKKLVASESLIIILCISFIDYGQTFEHEILV